jgi:hypothetical protein
MEMRRVFFATVVLCLGAAVVAAQDVSAHHGHVEHSMSMGQDWAKQRLEKSPRHHEWAAVKYGNRTVHCHLSFVIRDVS